MRIAREVFDKGNDFARKITYRTEGDPQDVLTAFRNEMNPRIAVTVDMIATGTDVKPIEVLIFMRDVKSAIYYEQMKGRGARTINATDLQRVTPDTEEKTHFLLIDAVGVTETLKADSQPLDRKRSVSFDEPARASSPPATPRPTRWRRSRHGSRCWMPSWSRHSEPRWRGSRAAMARRRSRGRSTMPSTPMR